jgi:hypothetical protein
MTVRLLLTAVLAAMLMLTGTARAAPPGEYQVKAVYLFNFGQFVEWPRQALGPENSPFVIGILGDDPFGKTIDDVVRGETLGSHPMVVKRFRDVEDISGCNILFIGRSERDQLDHALAATRGRSVLTVTDIDGAERQGAMIVLFNQDNRIRMRINLAEARASNLVISSKLLRPAEVIGREGD